MSVNDSPVGQPDDEHAVAETLELLTDDEQLWTAVPIDADGDDRLTHWITVEEPVLCDLDEWR